jgi:UDPglucose 6-dehydrogenase
VAGANAQEACRVPFELADSALEAVQGADALLIITEWPEFRAIDWAAMKTKMNKLLVFDGRNLFDPAKMSDLGVEYYGIGRQIRSHG